MNINKNNYESWFLDYHEGTLSAEKVAELFLFLEKYPELKNEFESFAQITLPSSEEVFFLKDSLKKNTITTANYNDYLIATLEDDLNLQERVALKTFMDAHPELEKEKLLFSKTILQKEVIAYPAKEQLKKHILVTRKYNLTAMWIAAAAMILLLLGVYFIQRPEEVQVAEKENNNSLPKRIESAEVNSHVVDNKNKPEIKTQETNTRDNNSQETASLSQGRGTEGEVNKNPKKTKQKINPEKQIQETNPELAMTPVSRIESQLILNVNEETPEKITVQQITASVIPQKRSFNPLQLFDNAKTTAANKINRATGDDIFYASSKTNSFTEERLPFKSRMIKLLAWTVKKVTNDNVKLKTDFDFDGNLASYQLSAGKFKVEKNF